MDVFMCLRPILFALLLGIGPGFNLAYAQGPAQRGDLSTQSLDPIYGQRGWDVPTEIESLNIIANRPGPTVWIAKKGEGRAYIMGSVSPVPDELHWDASRLEELIQRSDMVLFTLGSETRFGDLAQLFVRYPLQFVLGKNVESKDVFKLSGTKTLEEEIGQERYQDMAEFLKLYDLDIKKYDRAMPIAAVFDVTEKLLKKHDMLKGEDSEEKSLEIAKKFHKKIKVVSKYSSYEVIRDIKASSSLEQMQCYLALKRLHMDGADKHKDLARTWAAGKEVIYDRPASSIYNDACFSMSLVYQRASEKAFSNLWAETLNQVEAGHVVTVIVPAHMITRPNGLLATLKAAGVSVLGPPLSERRN